ncbi:unnamed protein product [Arctogadus glacialis]
MEVEVKVEEEAEEEDDLEEVVEVKVEEEVEEEAEEEEELEEEEEVKVEEEVEEEEVEEENTSSEHLLLSSPPHLHRTPPQNTSSPPQNTSSEHLLRTPPHLHRTPPQNTSSSPPGPSGTQRSSGLIIHPEPPRGPEPLLQSAAPWHGLRMTHSASGWRHRTLQLQPPTQGPEHVPAPSPEQRTSVCLFQTP